MEYKIEQDSEDSKWYVLGKTNKFGHSSTKKSFWRAANWEVVEWEKMSPGFVRLGVTGLFKSGQVQAEEYLETLIGAGSGI